jgi:O-antigen ligase
MARSARSRLHDGFAVWLLFVFFVSPIPFGGNFPLAWCALAVVVGASMLGYGVILSIEGVSPPVRFRELWLASLLWLGFVGFAAAQVLPLPQLSPPTIISQTGATLTPPAISLTPGQTVLVVLQLSAFGLLFYLVAQVGARERRARLLLRGLFWMGVGFAIFALIELTQWGDTLLGQTKSAYLGSATGTFVNRNSFATFLSLTISLGAALTADDVERSRREDGRSAQAALAAFPTVAGSGLLIATLLATQSRMGLFAGLCGAAVIVVLWLIKARRGTVAVAAIAAGVAAIAVFALYGNGVMERLGSAEKALDVRSDLYAQVWGMITARPWWGYGGGSFELAYPLFHRPPVSLDLVWDKAHSTYLGLWSDYGLLFGSIPMLLILSFALRVLRGWLVNQQVRAGSLAASGAIVVVAVHSLVDFSLEMQAVAVLFVAILAIGFVASRTETARDAVDPA